MNKKEAVREIVRLMLANDIKTSDIIEYTTREIFNLKEVTTILQQGADDRTAEELTDEELRLESEREKFGSEDDLTEDR